MNVRPVGDTAVLLDCASLDEAQTWLAALAPHAEVVLGAQSVLAYGDPRHLRALIDTTEPAARTALATSDRVDIPVVYDGPDLDEVARLTRLSVDDVIGAHTGTEWTVAFGGFAPGFSYLVGGDTRLQVPRRATPRTQVPSGAVGIAAEFSGIYPRESPGGWQLLGRTRVTLWDSDRQPPALLAPGQQVRFVRA